MLRGAPITLGEDAVDDAKAYLRIVGADEDELTARLLRSAVELCELFTRQVLIAREFLEILPASGEWKRLSASPVQAISGVELFPTDGAPSPLPAGAFAIDIDANGDGWVRLLDVAAGKRVRVSYEAGLAVQWSDAPEAIRQGVIRLVAHLYAHRDSIVDAGPPAAVTALWRPWRRMRLGG